MLGLLKNLWRKDKERPSFGFSRPLVALHSDDWGRVGVRDREGFELLRSQGLRLGEHAYDFYTLETAEDVGALAGLLRRHRDATGCSPPVMMNMCTSNLDFAKMRGEGFRRPLLLPLKDGLPGKWSRPGLMDAYRAGVEEGLFIPALHGMTHYSPVAVENALSENGERADLLRLLWEAETPYIFWRMPWIGYEYWNPERPRAGFLDRRTQEQLISQSAENFRGVFEQAPTVACAPGCRANPDTHRAWAQAGIRVAENGSGSGLCPPHFDEFGLLQLYRIIDFEPSHRELEIEKYLEIAGACFARGVPLIISVHSVNFHSTLKDFRTPTLAAMDELLTALETKFPELLYVTDDDIYTIVTEGVVRSRDSRVTVKVSQSQWHPRLAHQGVS